MVIVGGNRVDDDGKNNEEDMIRDRVYRRIEHHVPASSEE